MEYKLPGPPPINHYKPYEEQMRQYAEQAVAPLLAEIERLEKEKDALARAYVGMYRAK